MRNCAKYYLYVLLFLALSGCKTQEEIPQANYYKPVFDQTTKKYFGVSSNGADLDTLVLIRSNLRKIDEVFKHDFIIDNQFSMKTGDLAVPVEVINEKPPTCDTFLIVSDYRLTANYVNSVFPVIPDSLRFSFILEGDTLSADSIETVLTNSLRTEVDSTQMMMADTLQVIQIKDKSEVEKQIDLSRFIPGFLLNKEKRKARRSRKEIDRNIQLSKERKIMQDVLSEQNSEVKDSLLDEIISIPDTIQAVDTLLPEIVEVKTLFTKEEILADSTRDLLNADNIINNLISDAAWFVGDTIPIYQIITDYFLDSSLVLYFDTLYVPVFDSTKVVPQLTFEELVNEHTDTISAKSEYHINEVITFKVFHPEIDDVYLPMIRVRGGTFIIGSNEFDEDERPAYSISVSNFLLAKLEITNKLFCYFLNDKYCDSIGYVDGVKVIDLFDSDTKIRQDPVTKRFFAPKGYEDYPVVNISWIGAQKFCELYGGRLPSEAEWEYAAKGGMYAKRFYKRVDTTMIYDYVNRFAGGNYMGDLGWFVDNSRGHTWPGGKKMPNELGLYDMCGNVWEWCFDQYSIDFYLRNSKSKKSMCLDGGINRVNRGGSWSSDAMYCRITNRNYLNQYRYNQYLGFRYMREWK